MLSYRGKDLFKEESTSKKQGFLEVDNTNIKLPFTVIQGRQKGKTILITAGVHGAEYVAIETSKEISRIIDPRNVTGRIIIIHTVNVSGFKERRAGVTAEDGENLNRIFPGHKDGNVSKRLANFILENLSKKVDFYIDMHGGDLHGNIKPLIFYPVAVDEKISSMALAMAEASGFEFLVASTAKNGSYSRAALEGTPSILTELGGRGIWSKEEVSLYTERILNILDYLNIYSNNNNASTEITYFQPVTELISREEGFWYPFFKIGDMVKKGEKIGEIRDVFDSLLGEYFSPTNGLILYQTVALSTKKEGFLSAISAIQK